MDKKADCVFCKMIRGEIKVNKLYENDNFFAFPDANPKVKGHTLIIPKKHFINSMDLPSTLGIELFDAVKNVAEIHLQDKNVGGFNLVQNNFPAAGQVVMHFHLHFLPRRKDDDFRLNGL
ncbi:MAG: HIT domain-containing protein [Nanoarchaeota archaeon]